MKSFYQENSMILKTFAYHFTATQKVSALILHYYLSLPKRLLIIIHVNNETGLQLYASGVMIMERCEDLLPGIFWVCALAWWILRIYH